MPEDLKKAGAIFEDAPVVVDGRLVTSRWPMDLPDFMREVMQLVAGVRAQGDEDVRPR